MRIQSRFVDRCVTLEPPLSHSNDLIEQQEGIMGVIMIRCPSTGHAVSTGIETSSMDRLPTVTATTVCSGCGRAHEWTKAEAWLADGGEYYRQVAAERATSRRKSNHADGLTVGAHK